MNTAFMHGWYRSDVTITLESVDVCSGVKEIRYGLDGTERSAAGNKAVFEVAGDGPHNLSYYAKDNAGNSETAHPLLINIDKTPPVLNISAAPGILWPPNHKIVDVMIAGEAEDAVSKQVSAVFTVIDEYGSVQPKISGFQTTVPLEAWRDGADEDGRSYTLTVEATDAAGNHASSSTTVIVPHDMR